MSEDFCYGEPPIEDLLEPPVSNATLGALIQEYCDTVRRHSPRERGGAVRMLRLALKKGLSVEQIRTAITVYASDPFIRRMDERLRSHILTFFTYEKLAQWQAPVRRPKRDGIDPALDALDRLESGLFGSPSASFAQCANSRCPCVPGTRAPVMRK